MNQGPVLVINAGSSSVKYRLLARPSAPALAGGLLEGIGGEARLRHHDGDGADDTRAVDAPDHAAALDLVFERLARDGGLSGPRAPVAVGHRVVHGGADFQAPVLIDEPVLARLDALRELAPLHNGPNLVGIAAARRQLPGVPQVAAFDTGFHDRLPDMARHYALPLDMQRRHGIRRFGFHGLSHQYVAEAAAGHLGRPLHSLKLVTLHLGNGASACAIDGGRSVDTSMGFTPLEGLVMGSRCGDLDPSLPGHLAEHLGLTPGQLDDLLNKGSGLQGLCGDRDMRRIERRMADGDADARLAFELFCYRIRKYIGAYLAVLGGIDALVFTAGIGEHSAAVRAAACRGLEALGIGLDSARNDAAHAGIRTLSPPDARVAVLVVPTDEERQIAAATLDCIAAGDERPS